MMALSSAMRRAWARGTIGSPAGRGGACMTSRSGAASARPRPGSTSVTRLIQSSSIGVSSSLGPCTASTIATTISDMLVVMRNSSERRMLR